MLSFMNRDERNKLHADMTECYKRFEDAVQNLIATKASLEAIEELKKVDGEFKVLNKKYWEWIDK